MRQDLLPRLHAAFVVANHSPVMPHVEVPAGTSRGNYLPAGNDVPGINRDSVPLADVARPKTSLLLFYLFTTFTASAIRYPFPDALLATFT